jgi:hypothetical protein
VCERQYGFLLNMIFLKNDDDDRAAAYLQQQQQQFVESAKMFATYETFLVIGSKYNNFFFANQRIAYNNGLISI